MRVLLVLPSIAAKRSEPYYDSSCCCVLLPNRGRPKVTRYARRLARIERKAQPAGVTQRCLTERSDRSTGRRDAGRADRQPGDSQPGERQLVDGRGPAPRVVLPTTAAAGTVSRGRYGFDFGPAGSDSRGAARSGHFAHTRPRCVSPPRGSPRQHVAEIATPPACSGSVGGSCRPARC